MNDLDAKLARLGERVKARSDDNRAKLEAMGALDLALALRETFQARCIYLGPDAGYPHGRPYNFDLRPSHAATDPADRYAPSATERSANQPYRGKTNYRKGKRPPAKNRASDPPKTWHDLQDDRGLLGD